MREASGVATAKITSKGQVTIPVEVRRALGVEEGDVLVFEAQGEYATVRKRESAHEYFSCLRAAYPARAARFASDDEALADYYRNLSEEGIWGGDSLYACRFTQASVDAAIGADDEDR